MGSLILALKYYSLDQILKVAGIVRRSIVAAPEMANRKLMKSKHIQDANLSNRRAKQFRCLRNASANK